MEQAANVAYSVPGAGQHNVVYAVAPSGSNVPTLVLDASSAGQHTVSSRSAEEVVSTASTS